MSTLGHMQLDDIVRGQRGLITRAQVSACGISSSAWCRRVNAGIWRKVFPGVYLMSVVALSPEVRIHAVMLWLGPTTTLCGPWAAWRHGLIDRPRGPISVTVPASRRVRHPSDVDVRRKDLLKEDRTVVRGVPATTRALTALECADLPDGLAILDRAMQLGTTRRSLTAAIERLTRSRTAVPARAVLRRTADGAVSHAERRFARLMREASIGEFTPGVWVEVEGARFWLDFACEELRIGIEIDGWRVHSTGAAFHTDRARGNQLVRGGWMMLHYTPLQLDESPAGVVDEVRQVIAARRRELGRTSGQNSR